MTYGRACVWHAEALDGFNALPDAHARACEYRDEPACAGLQPETVDQHVGYRWNDESDQPKLR